MLAAKQTHLLSLSGKYAKSWQPLKCYYIFMLQIEQMIPEAWSQCNFVLVSPDLSEILFSAKGFSTKKCGLIQWTFLFFFLIYIYIY